MIDEYSYPDRDGNFAQGTWYLRRGYAVHISLTRLLPLPVFATCPNERKQRLWPPTVRRTHEFVQLQ